MLDAQGLQNIIATTFFGGNTTVAGLVMFALVMLLVLVLVKDKRIAILASMPIVLIFGLLGVVNTDMMVLLIIVAVLSLSYTAAKDRS